MEKEEEPKFEFITSSKNKHQIILEHKHIYNFFNKDKKDNQTFRCTYYKKANKCSSFIKIDKDKNIIEYSKYHNHNISEKESPKAKVKSEIKDKIAHIDNPFNIKGIDIYKEVTKNADVIIPEYKTVRSIINREINKTLPKEINSWDDIPEDHEFYKTISYEDFLVKKSEEFILFQWPYLAKLHLAYKENIFCDATFYTAPSISYQLL